MNKKVMSLALSSIMMLSSATGLAAATTGNVYKLDGSLFATGNEMNVSSSKRNQVNAQQSQMLYGFNGKYYSMKDAQSAFAEAKGDMSLFATKIALKDEVVIGAEELKVVGVSAINKTSVVVKLNKNAEEVLTPSFFNVTGATVTSVEQGVTPNVWVLNINSLDGTKGTVAVNGKSVTYDYTTPATAKAKVESVNFSNYRQFKVTFSEVVDEVTAIDPGNYYFEIVEGEAGDKLGAAVVISGDQKLSDITGISTWFDKKMVDGKTIEKRNNISAEVVGGKTVVTINLPGDKRFAAGLNGADSLQIKSTVGGYEKLLTKDVTVNIAVRNVKDASGVRKIDTAVFPMLINDSVRPELVGGSIVKLDSAATADTVVAFNPVKTATVEVERFLKVTGDQVSSVDRLTPDLTNILTLKFDEPVMTNSEFKVYVDGAVVGSAASFNVNGTYEKESAVNLDLAKALGFVEGTSTTTLHDEGDYKVDGKVHNIKIVAVKDLAGNITIPSTIEFNVKMVQPAQFGQEKPEVLDIEQTGDNVFRVYWNRADALGELNVLRSNGTEVKDVTIGASAYDATEKRYYSTVYLPSNDTDTEEDDENLEFMGQNFINRTFKITDMNVTAGDTPNTGKVYEKAVRVYKDINAPVLDKLIIDNKPTDYDAVKAGDQKLVLSMKDVTPFGANAIENDVMMMKYDSNGDYSAGGTALPVRVSYEKDGIVRSVEIKDTGLMFATNELSINLKDDADYEVVLNKDKKLVEGATYKVELPEGFFADPALKEGASDAQGFVAADRTTDYGFTSLAITANVTVPGQSDEDILDIVPQTSKQLITATFQPSVARDEIEIEFKGAIDPVTLKNPSNYTLNGKTLAAWGLNSSDITFVVEGADINDIDTVKKARFFAPKGSVTVDGAVEITVEGVANADGGKMTPVTTTVELKDNTAPEVISSKLDGAKNIVLTFDEPIAAVSGAKDNFVVKVDGQIIAVESVTAVGRNLTLVLSQNVPSPTSKIEIEVKKDNNGNIFVNDTSDAANKLVEGTVIEVQ